jgi:hypothetical protein
MFKKSEKILQELLKPTGIQVEVMSHLSSDKFYIPDIKNIKCIDLTIAYKAKLRFYKHISENEIIDFIVHIYPLFYTKYVNKTTIETDSSGKKYPKIEHYLRNTTHIEWNLSKEQEDIVRVWYYKILSTAKLKNATS